MKKFKNLFILIIIGCVILPFKVLSQIESKNGHDIPPRGTIKVLIVFAELLGGCADPNSSPNWPSGSAAPPNADLYLDYTVTANPSTFLTRYYRDISLGEYNVIGDYYDGTVQVPCSLVTALGDYNRAAIAQLNTDWQATGGNYLTKHGVNLNDFDNYQTLLNGELKPPGIPDSRIDATVILWRNHPGFSCGSGYGVGNFLSNAQLKNKLVNLYGSWDYCPDNLNTGYDGFFTIEFFHAIIGHNNFHCGGDGTNGVGTYMFDCFSYTTCQGYTSNIACGWDRNFLGWKGSRQYQISALNTSGVETQSDLSVDVTPNTMDFVLRDFITVGDAIRIKLPHFNWISNNDKKNQYLWIENHQLVSEFDINKGAPPGCSSWLPGLQCYIQTGKDIIAGSDVYGTGNNASPNTLNDWLFPLPAEGNWDFYYDISQQNQSWQNCQWNQKSVPYSTYYPNGIRKPNPFTGYSDLFGFIDTDQDGFIGSAGDVWQKTIQKWPGVPTGSLPPANLPMWGDELDAFTTTGQKISIATNPAPTPVYTIREGATTPSSYDNRSIHLNNLSVEIINNNYYNVPSGQPRAFLVRVKWDDNAIDRDVRWCGNIILKNDPLDPLSRTMQFDIMSNKIMTIDKGLSPTQKHEKTPGSGDFSDATFLHILNGTIAKLESGSQIHVINGSTFHVQAGGTLIIGPNASVSIDATSIICIEDGANILFQDPNTSKIIINGVAYGWDFNLQDVVLSTLPSDYSCLNTIITSGTTPGVTMPASGDVLLQARNSIRLSPNTLLSVQGTQSFTGKISDPIDCSNLANYSYTRQIATVDPSGTFSSSDPIVSTSPFLFMHQNDKAPEYKSSMISQNIELIPNPARDFCKIIASNYFNATLIISDLMGRPVIVQPFSSQTELNIANLKSGIYMIEIKTDSGGTLNSKLIKI